MFFLLASKFVSSTCYNQYSINTLVISLSLFHIFENEIKLNNIYGMELNNMTVGPKTPCFWFLLPDISRIPLLSDHQN